MTKIMRDRACVVCQKLIPAGAGAFRRGIAFVHVECANQTEKGSPTPPPTFEVRWSKKRPKS
jgi:hypothetical protein